MVPPYSDKVSRAPPYFSLAQYHTSLFTYGAITRYGQPFQVVPLRVVLSLTGFSDFARHYFRNLGWCLFLELLRCFSSPGSLRIPMYSVCDTFRWVSPFGNLRIKANLPAPRSLSQAITSFVAYHCQGIHHMLLFAWPYNFDLSCESKEFQGMLSGLSPNALCRIQIKFEVFEFKREVWYSFWRNQKIVIGGTVCTKPLRMCTFRQQRWFNSMNF